MKHMRRSKLLDGLQDTSFQPTRVFGRTCPQHTGDLRAKRFDEPGGVMQAGHACSFTFGARECKRGYAMQRLCYSVMILKLSEGVAPNKRARLSFAELSTKVYKADMNASWRRNLFRDIPATVYPVPLDSQVGPRCHRELPYTYYCLHFSFQQLLSRTFASLGH